MQESLANLDYLTWDQLCHLGDLGLVGYYDGWHITNLGWLSILKDRAPKRQIMGLL